MIATAFIKAITPISNRVVTKTIGPELVHPVEGLDGNCNFSRTGIVA